jgi:hypothetical protein
MKEKDNDKVHGEGNYAASKQYDDATKKFVQSGRVDDAAKAAAPRSPAEAQDMERAEQAGKRRAKEEDPELEGEDGDDVESIDEDLDDQPGETER